MDLHETTVRETEKPLENQKSEVSDREIAPNEDRNELRLFNKKAECGEAEACGQETAETAFAETKTHMLDEYGEVMSESHRAALESAEATSTLTVLSETDYASRFPEVDPNVLGHCDAEGNIFMKEVSEERISHVSTHETLHLCADREVNDTPYGGETIIGGVHEIELSTEGTVVRDESRGINEGLTELYTIRELESRGEVDAAYSFEAYSESRMWAQRLEELVGKERLEGAYFGGDREGLKQEVIRLSDGDEEAWTRFSENIDKVEYSGDARVVETANMELSEQYINMLLRKDILEREATK